MAYNQKGINNSNYKHGKRCREYKNYCTDCKKEISYKSKICEQCRGKSQRKPKSTCLDCGTELSKRKYKRCKKCNAKLLGEKFKNLFVGENNPNFKGKIKVNCSYCNKLLERFPCKIKITENFFCNEEHYYLWLHIPENCSAYIDGKSLIKKYCIDCGKEITNISVRCRSCSQIGDLSPVWQGGISFEPYTPEFTGKLKESIRKRDNYTCQNCGMTEEEHLIVYGRILSIHHIDYNKKNCNENNLFTICLPCNARANFNRDYWQDFYLGKIGVIYGSISSN